MLRPYQERAIQMVRERHKDRPLLCLPTGAGKTSVAAEIIRRATDRGRRAIFLVHRRELVDQAVDRLAQFGVKAGRIIAGHPESRGNPAQVASIPSLLKRDHCPADLVIVDECSHAVSASWARCLARYPAATIIGLTATPIRLDGKGLGDLFGCILEPITTRELIDQGYLIEPRVFAPPIDLSKVRVQAGDYSIPELAERVSGLVGSITKTWQTHAAGQSTVAFAVNVEHSLKIRDAFRAIGVRAEHVDYQTPHAERARILSDLKLARIDLVSQVQLLTEGWDMPALQCAILARPTKSLALFRQMVGRVMRPPGPVLVLDHAGNHNEHGTVTEPVVWTLETATKRVSAGPAVRTCTVCFCVIPPLADVCPECGAPCTRVSEAVQPGVENPGELIEFGSVPARVYEKAAPDDKLEAYIRLVRVASEKDYRLGWARMQYKERFGTWPRLGEVERAEYKCSGHEWEPKEYGWKKVLRCKRCFAQTSAVHAGHDGA
jgi:superfamily II DNA or RNA helicase